MSIGSNKLKKTLLKLLCNYNLPLYEEVSAGFGARYDFYIPTNPPICFEWDSSVHTESNNFFFKDYETLVNYRNNDNMKNHFAKRGCTVLIRIDDNNYSEQFILEQFKEYSYILNKGINVLDNEYLKLKKQDEYKIKNKEYKQNVKNIRNGYFKK